MKRLVVSALVITLSFLLKSCNSVEPTNGLTINLKLEDVSCTEAWIKLRTTNLPLPITVTLKQNNQDWETINLNKADTLLCIGSLSPKQNYSFQAAIRFNIPAGEIKSNILKATTMDTTSHNFSWQSWTFGEHSSSVLYDVAIINEYNILAVGEIYLNDSLGQPDPTPYNAVHWDGTSWTIKRIPTKTFSGTIVSSQIRTIFAFSENDIWTFSIAGSYSHWNGSNWETEFVIERDGSGNKLWGTSSSNLYLACTNGGITYYGGTSWQKLETAINVNLTDIFGTPDGSEVWACGWNNSDGHTVLLRINNNHTEIIYDSFNPANSLPYNSFISSLWTNGKLYFWLTGISDGAVKHSILDRNIAKKESFGIQYFPYRIRGEGLNDISLSGDAAIVWHYNGYSWEQYEELLNVNEIVRSIDMKDGIIAAVGRHFESILADGLIIVGRR